MTLTELRAKGAGRMKEMGAIAAVTMIILGFLAPDRLGTVIMKINLISAAAYGGYWIDRWSSRPERRPHLLVGLDRSMAEQRRAWIMSAAMLALALGL